MRGIMHKMIWIAINRYTTITGTSPRGQCGNETNAVDVVYHAHQSKAECTLTMVSCPDRKVHGANIGPTWVLSAPDGPHVGPMKLAIMVLMGPQWGCMQPAACYTRDVHILNKLNFVHVVISMWFRKINKTFVHVLADVLYGKGLNI